ncbi:uncharacterized protein LOC106061960 isoform X1 [Biomphalaria glabrata]|uniref:Uncharacterized protein LOC106061960 isoform X1 n=2 Tax=Biomphalaria glabrata TaxID=6526 RepID=A0A9W2ZU21_BIOGL|nr:uncharacterized protein LOC106061960 isoform X1 [Biomphalaria glabrata]
MKTVFTLLFRRLGRTLVLLLIVALVGLYFIRKETGVLNMVKAFSLEYKGQIKVAEMSDQITDYSKLTFTSCMFPDNNPFDPEVMKIAGLDKPTLLCNSALPDLTYLKENKLIVNKTKIKERFPTFNVTCKYQDITRQNDRDRSFAFSEFRKPFQESMELPSETEYILVLCEGTRNLNDNSSSQFNSSSKKQSKPEVLSRTYFAFIPKLDNLNEIEELLLRKRFVESSPSENMSVIMIGYDSVSRYHFMRAMNRTYDFLVNDLLSFDMTMHSQVGKNSFPNFLPFMTGRSAQETYQWWSDKKNADPFDHLWKDFERAGYRTFFSEDNPGIGAFNYLTPGFLKTPATHYSKSIAFAIEQDELIRNASSHCIGNQPEVLFHLEYLKSFLDKFPRKPLYALLFFTRISHDDITMLRIIDDHVYSFFKKLKDSGHLNNTMMITFSDHGPRYGPIRHSHMGDVENRNPLLIFTMPTWFLHKYPDVAGNLKTNTGRLTSQYDIHATVRDLLYFRSTGDNPLPKTRHGMSLFQEVPRNRTCQDASVSEEFCLCNYQNFITVLPNSSIAHQVANKVVEAMNARLDHAKCESLKLHNVSEVYVLKVLNKLFKLVKTVFRIKVETVPGNGVFDATVHVEGISDWESWEQLSITHLNNVTVAEGLDRLNRYSGQSDCVSDPKIQLICYCKGLLKAKKL